MIEEFYSFGGARLIRCPPRLAFARRREAGKTASCPPKLQRRWMALVSQLYHSLINTDQALAPSRLPY